MADLNGAVKKGRFLKIVLWHLIGAAAGVAYGYFIGCPMRFFFSFPCPTCGCIRAVLAAVSLDFSAAFAYHPLFLLALAVLLYYPHRRLLPPRFRLGKRGELVVGCLAGFAFVLVYIIRVFVLNIDVLGMNLH